MKQIISFFTILFLINTTQIFAQKDTLEFVYDTFFLAKKKGWIGDLGRSIAADPPKPEVTKNGTIKNDLPYNKYKGFIINKIYIFRLGFNQDINDTTPQKRDLGVRIANALHIKTKEKFIKANLFFNEGDNIFPYLIADNERHLRSQPYLQDAKIVIKETLLQNSADVYVYVKDNFSIGAGGNLNGNTNFDAELKDENFLGNAARLSAKVLYDESRNPKTGFGAEYLQRNIGGSFADFSVGFKAFNNAFSSGKPEESYLYAKIDRALVSPYLPFTGNAEISLHQTKNAYTTDSIFEKNSNYKFIDFDAWGGYNLGTKRYLISNTQSRIRKFIALRVFHHQFQQVPGKYVNTIDLNYINSTGFLGAINIFKQNFYKAKYIYGFGRQEDVPEGFNVSLIGGWTNKQNIARPYYGIDFARNYFGKTGNYYNYTFRLGGYINSSQFEDIDVLLNLEYFSKLKHIGRKWYLRNFTNWGITHQIRPSEITQRLYLNSAFGLPEFSNGDVAAQTRITAKFESVLYNNFKLIGFKFAPFLFLNSCYLVPFQNTAIKGDFYSSVGGGLRTRNEALVFGTIECRFNYFPRINEGMTSYRLDFKTDLRFTYNSTFIKKPDFVSAN
jgi:hypothetical protein